MHNPIEPDELREGAMHIERRLAHFEPAEVNARIAYWLDRFTPKKEAAQAPTPKPQNETTNDETSNTSLATTQA